ncbi:MAG: hypothetical protein R3D71_00955 [Rickettsiales bacterium]
MRDGIVFANDYSLPPVTNSEIIRDKARINFEWPKPTDFTLNKKGKKLIIKFSRKAEPDVGNILSKLYPYITHAKRKSDGRTLILALNKNYKISKFTSGNTSGIEIAGIKQQNKEIAKKLKTTNNISIASNINTQFLSKLEPAAGGSEQHSTTETTDKKTTDDNNPSDHNTNNENKADNAKETLAEESAKSDINSEEATDKKEDIKEKPTYNTNFVDMVTLSAASDSATLRFPLKKRTAVAVFIRNKYLWIVLDTDEKLNFSELLDVKNTVIGTANIIANPKVTILYMPIDGNAYASISKEVNSNNIAILITQEKAFPKNPIQVEVNTKPPSPPHALIQSLETSNSILIQDPIIGDELVIIPVFKTGEAIASTRSFVEFDLLRTTQGIVAVKKSDNLSVLKVRNGLRVTTTKGAIISDSLPKLDINDTSKRFDTAPTLFPYGIWKKKAEISRITQIHELLKEITKASTPQKANEARLRMAQLYLSEGLAPEAIAILDNIESSNPAFYRTTKLNAMRGAANFIMERYVEAAKDFKSAELNNNREIEYWRAVLADLLGDTSKHYDYLSMNEDYIDKYPPIFRQHLAIIAADRAITAKKYNAALRIFDSLDQDNLLKSIDVYINFLMAKISMNTGQKEDGLKSLRKLADNVKYPFVQARAKFTLITHDMEAGENKDKTIDKLEKLRLSWHGDNLELQILKLLGDLYYEKKDYVNAMRVWDNGVQSFRNTTISLDMKRKMEEVFITMFNDGGAANKFPPLKALALYYNYRNYMPIGAAGNEMMEKLAERLVNLDLLEQAIKIFEYQMTNQTEKQKRSEIGARLAQIYLMRNKPKNALQALQNSLYGENPVLLRLSRNRIAARAMAEIGKTGLAIQTLGQDESKEAEDIRVSIYWKEKNWEYLISEIENILKKRENITDAITIDESEYLLKLALAYIFTNNKEQIKYLRDYFLPLMKNNPNYNMFEYLTTEDVVPNSRNFNQIIEYANKTNNFVKNYTARIKISDMGKGQATKN